MTLEQKIEKLLELTGAAERVRTNMLQLHLDLGKDADNKTLVIAFCFSNDIKKPFKSGWGPTVESAVDMALANTFKDLQKIVYDEQLLLRSLNC